VVETTAGPLPHSLACDLTMWDEQAAVLRRNFKVLRFDTRWHCKSDAPDALPLWQGRIKTAHRQGGEHPGILALNTSKGRTTRDTPLLNAGRRLAWEAGK